MSVGIHKRTKVFKPIDNGESPVFQNTLVVVITYVLIALFYAKQLISLTEYERTWEVALNMLVDAVGVSTITYILTVVFQSLPAVAGTNTVSLDIWLVVLCFVYAFLFGVFMPRPVILNIVLCFLTAFAVWAAAYCVSKTVESGQTGDNIIEGGNII